MSLVSGVDPLGLGTETQREGVGVAGGRPNSVGLFLVNQTAEKKTDSEAASPIFSGDDHGALAATGRASPPKWPLPRGLPASNK